MGKDRIIIFAALIGIVLSLAGAGALIRPINDQRVDLQLTANEELMENLPPEYALPYMALGAFRGAVINVLWVRLEQMKQDGKFWEAMQLSEMITKLQPRFPQVWANRAWNLSYNISVATHTVQERWMWVRAGIDLLREEGIPNNPNALLLYKELSWIFLHKIGMDSDDLHRYYKLKLAEEWHILLGEPPNGTTQEVVDNFRPIAEMYDKYINRRHLTLKGRELLRELLKDPEMKPDVQPFSELPAARMEVKAKGLYDKLNRNEPKYAARLKPLLDELRVQRENFGGDPAVRFREGEGPEVAAFLDELAAIGYQPDEKLVDYIGRLRAFAGSEDAPILGVTENLDQQSEADKKLREWFGGAEVTGPPAKVLAFARARVLDEQYNMDPLWMLELMEGRWFVHPDTLPELEAKGEVPAIPLDWRHPAAHGLYWGALGVRKSQGLINPADFDLMNTDRNVLHALQQMRHRGKYIYDPVSGFLEAVPDWRYIDAYHYAAYGAPYRIISERVKGSAAIESFEAGHENFLIWSVQDLYFAGMTEKAERYYALLREKFTDREAKNYARYRKPLAKFVNDEFVDAEAITDKEAVNGFIHYMLRRAIDEGLVAGRPDVAKRFADMARQVHKTYQDAQDERSLVAPDQINRMALPPFNQIATKAFEGYLSAPAGPAALLIKSRVWRNLGEELQRRLYDGVKPRLVEMAKNTPINPDLAFPEPPGMEEHRAKKLSAAQAAERQEDPDLFETRHLGGQR